MFKDLNDWFEEFRMYHRKDSRVVKERDDLMSATRHAVMMLRDAKTLDWYRLDGARHRVSQFGT